VKLGQIISGAIGGQAPDWGIWQADGAGSRPGLIRVRRPHWPSGFAIEIPASGVDSDAGAPVDVRHHNRNRQLPYARRHQPHARGKLGSILAALAHWLQPESSHRISCRNALTEAQLKLSTAGTPTTLVSLDRTADSSTFAYDQERTDVLGLLLYKIGEHTILACAHAVWADADSMTAETVEVREYALAGTANTPVSVTVDTQRWRATNAIWPSRSHGYFFADVVSGDVILTLAMESGIVAFKRSVSGVQISSPWVEDDRRFGGRAGSIACVQQYLMECGYSGLNLAGGSVVSGGARLQLYTRDSLSLEYAPATPVELADLITGLTTGTINRRAIFPVGLLQPLAEYPSAEDVQDGGWSHNLLSNR